MQNIRNAECRMGRAVIPCQTQLSFQNARANQVQTCLQNVLAPVCKMFQHSRFIGRDGNEGPILTNPRFQQLLAAACGSNRCNQSEQRIYIAFLEKAVTMILCTADISVRQSSAFAYHFWEKLQQWTYQNACGNQNRENAECRMQNVKSCALSLFLHSSHSAFSVIIQICILLILHKR